MREGGGKEKTTLEQRLETDEDEDKDEDEE
jgi:hypothetical protein